MPRASRTIRHLADPKFNDGTASVPPEQSRDPTWVPRLSWHIREQMPFRAAELAHGISGAGSRGVLFFCDNSIFDDRLDPRILRALLSGTERIAVTSEVEKELQPWLRSRPDHELGRALRRGSRAVRSVSAPGLAGQGAFEYYVTLLRIRRKALKIGHGRFIEEFGREPAEQDKAWLHGYVQSGLGERGMLLGLKPSSPHATDEILVYLAVEFALGRGRPTVILTRDADVEDQFYKLLWLIDTHYRGMLLAAAYASDPDVFSARPFPPDVRGAPSNFRSRTAANSSNEAGVAISITYSAQRGTPSSLSSAGASSTVHSTRWFSEPSVVCTRSSRSRTAPVDSRLID